MRKTAAVLFLTLACAPATRGRMTSDDVVPDSFEPLGEIIFATPSRRTITAFDDSKVIGPGVSLTRNSDGSWSGWLQGRAVQLEAHSGRVDGATLSLNIEERDDGGVEIRGHWSVNRKSEQLYLRVTPGELFARGSTGSQSLFLKARGVSRYGGEFFGDYAVELNGAAALPHPREPQFALALLGTLSG